MILARMTRADLEVAVLEESILPCDAAGLEAIGRMTDEELRAAVHEWILAADECAAAPYLPPGRSNEERNADDAHYAANAGRRS